MNKATIKKDKGFTLVEVVVVIAIIAILSLLIIGAITVARNAAAEATNRQNGHTLRLGLEAHHARHGVYCAESTTAGQILCPTADITFQALSNQLNDVGFTTTLRPTTGSIAGGGSFTDIEPQTAAYKSANAAGDELIEPIHTMP